jgi:hypothetical protein
MTKSREARLTKAEVIELITDLLDKPVPSLKVGLARLFLAATCVTTTDRDQLLAACKPTRRRARK